MLSSLAAVRCCVVFLKESLSSLDGMFTCIDGVFICLDGVFTCLNGMFTCLDGLYTCSDGLFTFLMLSSNISNCRMFKLNLRQAMCIFCD